MIKGGTSGVLVRMSGMQLCLAQNRLWQTRNLPWLAENRTRKAVLSEVLEENQRRRQEYVREALETKEDDKESETDLPKMWQQW